MGVFLNWRLWLALALAAAASYGAWWLRHDGYVAGKTEVTAAWNVERASVAAQSLKLAEQATRVSVDLQAKSDQQLKDKNAKIRALNTAVAVVLASLHDRPDRPAAGSVPEATSAGGGCTGASLFAPDASVLVGIAQRADTQRLQLDACQTQYSAARQAINASAP